MDIDPITGLPKELGAFEDISKESQQIDIKLLKRKFGKRYTVIEGIASKNIDIRELTRILKNRFSCGGTFKDGKIELQGDFRLGVKESLKNLGFKKENIRIK